MQDGCDLCVLCAKGYGHLLDVTGERDSDHCSRG